MRGPPYGMKGTVVPPHRGPGRSLGMYPMRTARGALSRYIGSAPTGRRAPLRRQPAVAGALEDICAIGSAPNVGARFQPHHAAQTGGFAAV